MDLFFIVYLLSWEYLFVLIWVGLEFGEAGCEEVVSVGEFVCEALFLEFDVAVLEDLLAVVAGYGVGVVSWGFLVGVGSWWWVGGGAATVLLLFG